MSEHFSSEDISRWVAGDRPPGLSGHLGLCRECRVRIDAVTGALGQFRDAIHGASAAEDRLANFRFEKPSRVEWPLAWTAVAATAALAVVLMSPSPAPRVVASESSRNADAELLSRVQEQISRSVPEQMEPLTELFAWSLQSPAVGDLKADE